MIGASVEPINVFEYETLAQANMDPAQWDFFQGGSDDEVTLRANRAVFERIEFVHVCLWMSVQCARYEYQCAWYFCKHARIGCADGSALHGPSRRRMRNGAGCR